MDQHSYEYDTQCKLVMCAIMFHNYIRQYNIETNMEEEENDDDDEEEEQKEVNNIAEEDNQVMSTWRDEVAQKMWDQYQIYLGRRRRLN